RGRIDDSGGAPAATADCHDRVGDDCGDVAAWNGDRIGIADAAALGRCGHWRIAEFDRVVADSDAGHLFLPWTNEQSTSLGGNPDATKSLPTIRLEFAQSGSQKIQYPIRKSTRNQQIRSRIPAAAPARPARPMGRGSV